MRAIIPRSIRRLMERTAALRGKPVAAIQADVAASWALKLTRADVRVSMWDGKYIISDEGPRQ